MSEEINYIVKKSQAERNFSGKQTSFQKTATLFTILNKNIL